MSDLLAPPAIRLRRRSTMETLALDPARELGAGGEARVLAVPGDDSLVAKLYHEPTPARARKVALMMEEPPELDASAARLAWPCDLLFDAGGAFAGFLMPRVEGPRVFEFYNPVTRRRTAPHADYAFLLRVAANVAAAFEALHARGYVIGDVNESNLLVGDDASVTLVDTDSMQVRDPADGAVHRSRVGKAEFTPPELQGRSFADFDRSPEHDRFGLAVLLFLLLMEGTHPFAGRLDDGGEMPPIEERIRRGLFPHDDHAEIRPPRLAPDFSLLAPGLRVLFVRCFEDGHADPAARPTAAEWRAALVEAEAKLVACDVNPRHRHGRHLGACPWCARMAVLRVPDPFPADADADEAPPAPARVPVARIAPATKAAPPAPKRAAAPRTPAARKSAPPTPAAAPAVASVPPPSPADGWGRQATGRLGLLHPGAWVAPTLVMALGPMELLPLGMVTFPFVAFFAVIRIMTEPRPKRRPGTFALPAVVLLVLALWISSALGRSWLLGGEPAYEPAPYSESAIEGVGELRIGEASTPRPVDSPVLQNREAILSFLRRWYRPRRPDQPHDLRVTVHVRQDGTVDPARTRVNVSTDPALTEVVWGVVGKMVFVPLRGDDGAPYSGPVSLEITYAPFASVR